MARFALGGPRSSSDSAVFALLRAAGHSARARLRADRVVVLRATSATPISIPRGRGRRRRLFDRRHGPAPRLRPQLAGPRRADVAPASRGHARADGRRPRPADLAAVSPARRRRARDRSSAATRGSWRAGPPRCSCAGTTAAPTLRSTKTHRRELAAMALALPEAGGERLERLPPPVSVPVPVRADPAPRRRIARGPHVRRGAQATAPGVGAGQPRHRPHAERRPRSRVRCRPHRDLLSTRRALPVRVGGMGRADRRRHGDQRPRHLRGA